MIGENINQYTRFFYPKDLSLPEIPTDCPNHRDGCSSSELTFVCSVGLVTCLTVGRPNSNMIISNYQFRTLKLKFPYTYYSCNTQALLTPSIQWCTRNT
ncbi:hypothetical protein HanXRQr2_Chr12g0540671 [Helianthus annuus]|uniref:Uncharacterized protein n=1 Tax=Helianthus annuus TaxID=4232 RepID=A0A9K3MVT3_HELAN|nr:hypothetical protein HanXRQr2_Chr12g0540671 [Helianthus annuus]KAJ0862624.1 hypothetical protein HanPSC8_Chr12g0520421 [Helianthus annuus]